jgi:hypothetical protein
MLLRALLSEATGEKTWEIEATEEGYIQESGGSPEGQGLRPLPTEGLMI